MVVFLVLIGASCVLAGWLVGRRRQCPTGVVTDSAAWDSGGSVVAHLDDVPYPPPRCSRCGAKIVKEREGDRYWIRTTQRALFKYHVGCADQYGEPLPPRGLD